MITFIQFFNQIPLFLLIVLSGVALIFGDLAAKYWSVSKNPQLFVLAVIFYLFYAIFFIPTLAREKLVISGLAVIVINIVGIMIISLLIFNEKLTYTQWIGVVFGVISIILLEI